MGGLLLAIAGIWLLAVGIQGNASSANAFILEQKAFIAWLVAAAILYALAQIKPIKPAVEALVALALIAIVVHQWPVIQSQWTALSSSSTTANQTNGITGGLGTTGSSAPGLLP